MFFDLSIISHIHVIPTGELPHDRLDITVLELKVAVLPGNRFIQVDIVRDHQLHAGSEGRLLTGGHLFYFTRGMDLDTAFQQGGSDGGLILICIDIEMRAQYLHMLS